MTALTALSELDRDGPVYLGASRAPASCDVALVGVPFDGTASWRSGARFGPDAIRVASVALETYSPRLDRDTEDIALGDYGNVVVGTGRPEQVVEATRRVTSELLARGARPLLLGGDHSWTPGAVRAVFDRWPDVLVMQLDAHADLRDGYLGEPFSHAAGMRRCLDFLASSALLQVGIRSGTREEWRELRASGRLVAASSAALRDALASAGDRPIYVTCDLDVFDPAVLSGTGVPEPGGIDWAGFEVLLDELRLRKVVASDVVELAPALDPSGASAVLAAKVVRELALVMAER